MYSNSGDTVLDGLVHHLINCAKEADVELHFVVADANDC